MAWEPLRTSTLTRAHLQALASGDLPIVVIPSFWPAERAAVAAEAIRRRGLGRYATPSLSGLGLIGIAMSDHKEPSAKESYFEKVPAATAERLAIFAETGDPVADFITMLQAAWDEPVEFSSDGDRALSPSIIRGWDKSTEVHIDWAPIDTRNWPMSDILGQWSVVMHLAAAVNGGGLKVYQREYTAACQPLRQPNSWGYDRAVVSGIPVARYRPAPGDLVIIFTKYFHEVEPVQSSSAMSIDRITVSSFVGWMPDGRLVLWG
jgi:hypothetical protein